MGGVAIDTVAHAETVESGLDALIEKRDKQRRRDEGERLEEELFMPSVRRYEERLQRERLWERLRYHDGQARRLSATVAALVARHEAEAQRYAEMLGIASLDGGARGEGDAA